ncbi:hypothetical protein ACS0TY_015974 [Phlomoides rotata]
MDSVLFSREDDEVHSAPFDRSFLPPAFADPGESIYLVPLRWWKEAVRGGGGGNFVVDGGVRGVLYNATAQMHDFRDDGEDGAWSVFGDSDISVDMRREGEAGISGEEGGVEDLALVSEWMFFTALKWHFDNRFMESSLPGEDTADNLFSLHISLVYTTETKRLAIQISSKDNGVGVLNQASRIFLSKSGMFQIWDFSGQMDGLFVHDSQKIVLKLQIYGLPYTINAKEIRNEDMIMKQPRIDGPSSSSSFLVNGSVDRVSRVPPFFAARNGFHGSSSLGLTGLQNLGNTCFMNSAIQCLAHTPKLVDYFLGDFRKDLNHGNPLGMNGKLAIAFGDLLRKLWTPGVASVAPNMLKSTISSFAPQFNGYHQHDSQELLSFLLDGLHEDLNRVKRKPYVQAKEEDDRPDEEVADEYWKNHLSRNDSIIVDLCQGQYRSSLVCPICKKLSVTFDPFMYLSLPLPSSSLRKMTVTIFSTDGTDLPHPVTITVPNSGTSKDLVEALGLACSLRNDETLLIAEIFNNSIFRILDAPSDSLDLIRDHDRLVAYRFPKDMDGAPLVVFTHQEQEKSYTYTFLSFKKFGVPLVARISDFSNGSGIYKEFLKLINPFLLPSEEYLIDDDASRTSAREEDKVDDTVPDEASNSKNEFKSYLDAQTDFEFHLVTGSYSSSRIEMNEPVPILKSDQKIEVSVSWSHKMIQEYDTSILSVLPEVCKERPLDSISLYKCVDAFLREEPLGPDDMWYCPKCKVHRQASKKLDLWRLPEILVVHLKRFSYTKYWKNKLETFVDFPVDDFDLSNYILHQSKESCNRYMLYAISNHYGGMGGGHYTAFAKHEVGGWYEFDDSGVFPTSEERIKNQAAYLLFYKRI